MRILLVNIPFYRLLGTNYNAINLGLGYTAAALQDRYDTWIYNADFLPNEYNTLKNIFNSNETYGQIFDNSDHEIWEETTRKILEFEPCIVGYSAYTANLKAIDIVSRKVSEYDKNIVQIIGGPHAILEPNIGNKLEKINYVFYKEGEYLFWPLRNIIPIDAFKFPEKDKIWGVTKEEEKYLDRRYIITSRGCPYQCTFCASSNIWKKKVRFRNPDFVVEEIKQNMVKYNMNEFYFLDDTLVLDKKRALSLFEKIEKLNIKWECNVRLDRLDKEVCYMMKKSGCINARVGVESGSDRILKMIKKGETKKQMREGIKNLVDNDIPVTCYLMTGFPGETDADLRQTIDFAKEINADKYSLSVFAPYYGSEIFNDLNIKDKRIRCEYFYHQSPRPLVNDDLSEKLLQEYFSLCEM